VLSIKNIVPYPKMGYGYVGGSTQGSRTFKMGMSFESDDSGEVKSWWKTVLQMINSSEIMGCKKF